MWRGSDAQLKDAAFRVTTGAPETEIEITPEMIEAGEIALSEYDSEIEGRDIGVCRIFRRMIEAKKKVPASLPVQGYA